MAKKQARKAAKKSAGKKAGKKAAKPVPAKKKASAKRPSGPTVVTTGRGPGPLELGNILVNHFNAGKSDEDLWNAHFSRDIVSVEGHGASQAFHGLAAVREKSRQWMEMHEVHGASAEGPFVGATSFAVRFRVDVTNKASGQRFTMEEVGVYTVQNGKVVREEFMYSMK